MTLKVLCARSMTTAVNALAGKFTRATGQELDITFATVGALQAKLAAGERADMLILGAPAMAKMEQAGAIVPGSGKDIARTSIGVAVRSDAPAPDISTAEAFKQTLLAARAIAFSDAAVGGSAGVHLARAVGADRHGRRDQAQGDAAEERRRGRHARGRGPGGHRPHPDRGDRADQGRAGGRQNSGAARQRYDLRRRISAGCADQAAAAAFIAALAQPAEREVWTAAGFERPG